jgi:hypothetical protein
MAGTFLKAVAAGTMLAVLVWLALSVLAVLVPREPIRMHLQAAFASGSLTDEDHSPADRVRGVSQFNDCVILSTAYLRGPSAFEDVASALWPIYLKNENTICGELHKAVTTGLAPEQMTRYHRYLFGQRGLVAGLLQFFSLDAVRSILLILNHVMAAAIFLLGIVALRTAGSAGAGPDAGRNKSTSAVRDIGVARVFVPAPVLVLIGGMLTCFYSLVYFGQSVAHGPADLLLSALILYLATRDLYSPLRAGAILLMLALIGGLTAMFELLSGGLPMSVAAILAFYGLQALRAQALRHGRWPESVLPALQGMAAFMIGFVLLVVLKIGGAIAVFGGEVLDDFSNQLLYRLGAAETLPRAQLTLQAFRSVLYQTLPLFWGSKILTGIVLLGAPVCLLLGSLRIIRSRPTAANLAGYGMLLLSVLVVPVWYAIFAQHTVRHSWFMGRMMVWPIIGALLVGYVALRPAAPRSSQPYCRLTQRQADSY